MKYVPLLILAVVQGLEIFLCVKKLWFYYLLRNKYFVKLIFLSRVIPSSSTLSDDLMVSRSEDMLFSMFLYFERNISWSFDELATISLSLNHCIALFVSISSLKEMVSNSFPRAYRVVSSAKLHISISFMKKSKSLIKTLKRIGPSIDSCGIPRIISNHSLKGEPTYTLCCLWER